MIAADTPSRSRSAKLLHVDANGDIRHELRSDLVNLLRHGDVVVANDAATLPASLQGVHERTGAQIEVRLAGRSTAQARGFIAIVFGAGDHRTRTEDRPLPPTLLEGDVLILGVSAAADDYYPDRLPGPLRATVAALLDHPRLVGLSFEASTAAIWEGIAIHGRPIQYAHVRQHLELWDVWTAIAGPPVAYEAPSAGFALDWRTIAAMHDCGVQFATLTHAAGISSTGDAALDARLPLDEPYFIPPTTAIAVNVANDAGRRVIAIGTTVVRALEHAGRHGLVAAGAGVADQRIGMQDTLRHVDAIVSGTHEAGTSHYELLRALLDASTLRRVDTELESHAYRTHEFGDSLFIERQAASLQAADIAPPWRSSRRTVLAQPGAK